MIHLLSAAGWSCDGASTGTAGEPAARERAEPGNHVGPLRRRSRKVEIGSTRIAVRFIAASKLQRILAAALVIVSRERFGPCRTVFD